MDTVSNQMRVSTRMHLRLVTELMSRATIVQRCAYVRHILPDWKNL